VVVDKRTRKILCTAGSSGKKHDFKLLLESGVRFPKGVFALGDSGYQGLQNISGSALIPHKGSKHNPLTEAQKDYNHSLSSERIFVENVIGWLKRFRILAEKYRNRRRRFGLRFNLIAAIYNLELDT
jgi:IS5 family transposase